MPPRLNARAIVAVAVVLGTVVFGACSIGGGDDQEDSVSCEPRSIDLRDGRRPDLGLPHSDGDVLTECLEGSALYTLHIDGVDEPVEVEARAAFASRDEFNDRKLTLRVTLGPSSVEEAAREGTRLARLLGMQTEWVDEWEAEARAAPVPDTLDVRSRVLSADLGSGLDASMDLARQNNGEVVFVHLTVRWPTASG